MDINPALEVDPNADPNAGLRAAQIQRGLDAINRMIDLSLELAALIVEDAKQPRAEAPEAKAAKKPHHAADFDRLFRGVRRAVLVSQKLLDPPKPEREAPKPRQPAAGGKYPKQAARRGDRDYLDRPDTIDNDPPAPTSYPDDAEILDICRELNIMAAPGTIPLLNRPLAEVEILRERAEAALAKALQPLGLEIAWGEFPDLPAPDTS